MVSDRYRDARPAKILARTAHDGVAEILNLQPNRSIAKPYQVKQVRRLLIRYKPADEAP